MYSHADDGHLRGCRRSERVRRRRGAATAAGTPGRARGRADRGLERGGVARRPPASSAPARGPRRRADHPRGAGRPRRRRPRAAARAVRRDRGGSRCGHRGDRLRGGLPAHRRGGVGALLRRVVRRGLALRPPRAPRPARPPARGDPDRGARLLPDRLDARPGPRGRGRARHPRRRGGRGERHLRGRQGGQAAPDGQRGRGQPVRLRRRRRPPAHAGDHPEPRRGHRRSGHGQLHARSWSRRPVASSRPARPRCAAT